MTFDLLARRDALIDRVLGRLVRRAMRLVRPKIPSATLRSMLQGLVVNGRGILFLPHYWAVYVHDGRGVVTPKRAKWLVWFPEIQNDPRVAGGADYPVRVNQIRRLTRAQWLAGLAENRRRRAAGLEPYMVVSKRSGPARGVPFFEMLRLEPEAADIVEPELDRLMARLADEISETSTASARLG